MMIRWTRLHAVNLLVDVIPFLATMSPAQKAIALSNSAYMQFAPAPGQRTSPPPREPPPNTVSAPEANGDVATEQPEAAGTAAAAAAAVSPSLHSLLGSVPSTAFQSMSGLVTRTADIDLQFWFPLLFGLYEVTMSCELEIRTKYVPRAPKHT